MKNRFFSAVYEGYWGHRLYKPHSTYKLAQKYAKKAGINKVMSPCEMAKLEMVSELVEIGRLSVIDG